MEGQRRCYGCMNLKTQPICEHCGYDERRNNAPHQLPVGTVLRDQYVIGRALGQGGFGITYLGWDQYLDIPVAIKEYYPSGIVTRESAVSTVVCNYDGEIGERFQRSKERFMRESRTLARFSDMPEVVQVKSFFLANNTAYIVMEYVQGITMKEYVRRMGGRLTMEQTLEMLRPVIQTLEKLHREGVVHRDISPDNIMILPNGRMKLIDFGAVRDVGHADADIPLSRSTEAILKQGFAPIEQYQNRGSLGPWTDVYAMCATIYYCVTGHVLLDAPGRLLDSPELNLRQAASMTAQQEMALNRGLELLPAKRTRSMAELEQGLYGEPGGTIPLDDGKTIPLDDGKTIPLDDGKTIPLDDNRTIPLDRDRTVPKRDETKPLEDVVVEETKPKPQPKKKATNLTFKQRIVGIAGVLAVFALVCFFVSLGTKEPTEQNPPVYTMPPELQKEMDDKQAALIDGMNSQITSVVADNVLMEDVGGKEKVTSTPVFGSEYLRKQICSITFLNSLETMPNDAWDVSANKNGSVMAWVEPEGKLYALYIAANGNIKAPRNANGLFAYYNNVSSIEFNNCFDTSETVRMDTMFYATAGEKANMDTLDVSSFDTSKVTNMHSMFDGVMAKHINVFGFDTTNVTDMGSMFADCHMLEEVDLVLWNTYKVTDMSRMFMGCYQLRIVTPHHFDTTNVKDITRMFYGVDKDKLEHEIEFGNLCVENVTAYEDFSHTDLEINGKHWKEWFEPETVENAHATDARNILMSDKVYMECWDFSSDWTPNTVFCSEYDRSSIVTVNFLGSIDNAPTSAWDISEAKDRSVLAWVVPNGKLYDLYIAGDGGVVAPANCERMFCNYTNVTEINFNNHFDTSGVEELSAMFAFCSKLERLDINDFDFSGVEVVGSMFYMCKSLQYVDMSNVDTTGVTNMYSMFDGCEKLENVTIGDFDVSSVFRYYYFAPSDMTINGRPWQEYFENN